MNWQQFNDKVRVFLLVDSERKGRGVQEKIDSLIANAVRDLSTYVKELRDHQFSHYAGSTLVEPDPIDLNAVNAEDLNVHKGVFAVPNARIKQIIIRRIPTNDNGQDISQYFYPQKIPWEQRFNLIDSGNLEKSKGLPGRIAFGDGKFWIAPKVRDDEALYLYHSGELSYTPIYKASDDEKNRPVILDEMEAKAVSDYVKAELSKDVENDLSMYQAYMQMYQKERSQIYINRKQYETPSDPSALTSMLGGALEDTVIG
jgi:hypothetical protein